jgi:hypothetical protein
MSALRYVQVWLALMVLLLSAVLAVNFLVDPYRLRVSGSLGDAELLRPDVYSYVRLNKAFALARAQPDIVLLGSSRVQWGFERDALPFTGRKPFNLALSGPRFDEVWTTFQCMLIHGAPRIAVVGLDFTAFNMRSSAETQVFRCDHSWVRALATYASSTALNASVAAIRNTLADTDQAYRERRQVLDAQGFSRSRLRFEPRLSAEGHHALFRAVEDSYMRGYSNFELTDERGESLFSDFRAMLKQARASGIELNLFIQPEHARQLELVRAAGLWPTYENWKRTLVRIVEEESERDGSSIALWDFGNYDSITTENLPAPGDTRTRMQYFTDLSHYTPVVGNFILTRIFGEMQSRLKVPPGFGYRLTQNNVEARLQDVRSAQEAYRATHRSEVAELERRMLLQLRHIGGVAAQP